MKLLAIETATECCSAALQIDTDCIQQLEIAPRKHTQLILPMVDNLLAQAGCSISELDGIAFGQGPGAFTGLRVAIGVVQGLAFPYDIPVIPVSSLAALAQQFAAEHPNVAVAIDARMGEVYWGLFESTPTTMSGLNEERVCKPEDIDAPADREWFAAGTGWGSYQQPLVAKFSATITDTNPQCYPTAESVAALAIPELDAGNTIKVIDARPCYLRNNVVNN